MLRVLPGVRVRIECEGDGWQVTTTSTAVTLKVDGMRDIMLSFSEPIRRQAVVIIAANDIAYTIDSFFRTFIKLA